MAALGTRFTSSVLTFILLSNNRPYKATNTYVPWGDPLARVSPKSFGHYTVIGAVPVRMFPAFARACGAKPLWNKCMNTVGGVISAAASRSISSIKPGLSSTGF